MRYKFDRERFSSGGSSSTVGVRAGMEGARGCGTGGLGGRGGGRGGTASRVKEPIRRSLVVIDATEAAEAGRWRDDAADDARVRGWL